MITAIILTRNEERNITDCVRSVLWCDEILVIDDQSTDKTVALVKKFGPQVRVFEKLLNDGFAAKRNFALSKAKDGWVLFLDADERVSSPLAGEIKNHLNDRVNGFYLHRQDFFLGKKLRFGETANVRLLRLGRTDTGKWQRPVHEFWAILGPRGTLKNAIDHYPHPTINDFLRKLNFYSSLDAPEFKSLSFFDIIVKPFGKFILNYFLRLGCLDGAPGFIMAYMMSFNSLLVRVKQYELISPS